MRYFRTAISIQRWRGKLVTEDYKMARNAGQKREAQAQHCTAHLNQPSINQQIFSRTYQRNIYLFQTHTQATSPLHHHNNLLTIEGEPLP